MACAFRGSRSWASSWDRADVEAVGIEQRPLIVVAEQHEAAAIADEPDALAGIRPVADDVAEAEDGIDPLAVDILEDHLEGLEVSVNVADDGPLHLFATLLQTVRGCPIVMQNRRVRPPAVERGREYAPRRSGSRSSSLAA
jgi:hypothetical protein